MANPDLNADFDGRTLGDALMAPTRIYVRTFAGADGNAGSEGHGAHYRWSGLVENVPRVLGDKLTAVLHKDAWPLPPLFSWLQQHGGVADAEMHRVFNCGIGMVVIVSQENAQAAMEQLSAAGETVFRIGEIRARDGNEHPTIVV